MATNTLKYTVIRNRAQYFHYCDIVEKLTDEEARTNTENDEVDLLTLLIEKWDDDHNTFGDVDPVRLLKSIMTDHKLKARDLAEFLNISKGYVSDILNYKKGLSKAVIRKLSERFKLRQDAFNRPYKLKSPKRPGTKKATGRRVTPKLSKA